MQLCESAQVIIRAIRSIGKAAVPVPLYEAKAELFRTLGHPVRIRVLELLSERDHAVHELLDLIEVEQSGLSQHLAVLRRTGLVRQQRVGGQVVYSVLAPHTRDLLLSARLVLQQVLADRRELTSALDRPSEEAR
jgi:ArsR family transcriptional regulator